MATPLRKPLRNQGKLCVSWNEVYNFLPDSDDYIAELTIRLKVFFSI
jgi:hypothetical protein